MNWFWKRREWKSLQNKNIVVRSRFGKTEVIVGGCVQTSSDYTHRMWKHVFKRISSLKNPEEIRSALLLGLGAGGCIKPLHDAFPLCTLTAVEFDPTMVDIARRLQFFAPYPLPKIHCADAKDAISQMEEQFDLVVVDLFVGTKLSPLVSDEAFLKKLRERLASGGILVVNVLGDVRVIPRIASIFTQQRVLNFGFNQFAVCW